MSSNLAPGLITTPSAVASIFTAHKSHFTSTVALVATSGGFDPLHIGHLRCIQASAMLKGPDGLLVVIVNGDDFLTRKKGYVFMPLLERMELIASLRGVDFVVPWEDDGQFVTGALEIIKPNIFAKGGDRSRIENVPEYDSCTKIGCHVVFGIGGHHKIQSSSELVKNMQEPK